MPSYTVNTWNPSDIVTKTKLDRLEAGAAAALATADAPELIRDTIGTALVAGANMTVTVNDAGDTITLASTGGGGSATETVHTIATSGSSQTLNPTVTGTYKRVTLTANCTFTFAGATAGTVTRMDVELIEDATGGRTVTWPTVKWVGGVPTHITTANSISVYTFWSSDGSTWFGAPVGLGFA